MFPSAAQQKPRAGLKSAESSFGQYDPICRTIQVPKGSRRVESPQTTKLRFNQTAAIKVPEYMCALTMAGVSSAGQKWPRAPPVLSGRQQSPECGWQSLRSTDDRRHIFYENDGTIPRRYSCRGNSIKAPTFLGISCKMAAARSNRN